PAGSQQKSATDSPKFVWRLLSRVPGTQSESELPNHPSIARRPLLVCRGDTNPIFLQGGQPTPFAPMACVARCEKIPGSLRLSHREQKIRARAKCPGDFPWFLLALA